jgi:GTPase SAR1 family protein
MTYINYTKGDARVEIIKGIQRKPFAGMIYGPAGVGKSTFCKGLPSPLFVGADELDELGSDRLPKPKSYADFIDQLKWVRDNKQEHQTLCVDTIDSIETMLHQKILNEDKKSPKAMNKAHGGYGAAYGMALSEMTELRNILSEIRDKGINIMLICHSVSKKVSDPVVQGDYDEYQLTLHEKVQNLFVDWVSVVIFLRHDTIKGQDEKFAFGDGSRIAYFEKRPGFLAKNRFNFPPELKIDSDNPAKAFLDGLEKFYSGSERKPYEVKKTILALLENVQDQDLIKKVMETIEKQKTTKALEMTEARLKELING